MAKPNYSFQKRQRELEKKKKKEQKLQKKTSTGDGTASPDDATEQDTAGDEPAAPAPETTPSGPG